MRSSFTRKMFYMGIALGIFVIVYFLRFQIESVRNSRGEITNVKLPAQPRTGTVGQLNSELGIQLSGNRVVSVERDSPTYKAGVREGDVITAINGENVDPKRGPASLANLSGKPVRVEFFRFDLRRLLSEATLGDVDPTSSTMVLVLGGLRGVASNFLWSQALEMQKEHDWTNLEVVVKSIVKLEPHFISIWTFQGWNLAYNVSVEWDQTEDKYYWIKQGIKFLRQGTDVNEHSPELRWDVGWTYFHKLGKADEAALLRKEFQGDDKPQIDAQGREHPPFNPDGLDNFIASLDWFQKAVNKCDQLGVRPKRMGEVAFRSYPAHAQTDSVGAKEEEGQFGEQIQVGWRDALRLWQEFADHSYIYTEGKETKLDYPPEIFSDLYRAVTFMTRARAINGSLKKEWDKVDVRELDEDIRLAWPEQTVSELEKLNSEERAKLKAQWAVELWNMIVKDTPLWLSDFGSPTIDVLPTGAADALAGLRSSFEKMRTLDPSLLTRVGAEGDQARKQVEELTELAEKLGGLAHEELYWCDRYSTMINYRYWKERAEAESENDTIAARRHFFTGLERFRVGDPKTAKNEFESGLELWKSVLEKFNRMRDDDLTVEETAKIVRAYQAVCDQFDQPLAPDQIPFRDYIQKLNPTAMSIPPEQMQRMQREYTEMMKTVPADMQEEKKKEMKEKYEAEIKKMERSKEAPK